MFGYFLRRVDNRFQLARNLGVLPEAPEDAVARLERLISMVSHCSVMVRLLVGWRLHFSALKHGV